MSVIDRSAEEEIAERLVQEAHKLATEVYQQFSENPSYGEGLLVGALGILLRKLHGDNRQFLAAVNHAARVMRTTPADHDFDDVGRMQ